MNKGLFWVCLILLSLNAYSVEIPSSRRSETAINSVEPILTEALAAKGLKYGAPIYIRIFKTSAKLEVWVQNQSSFQLFKTYDICAFSGDLGPKTKTGDGQAPEGFYFVGPGNLNPWSSYHLSFNIGYPNAYDRAQGYTGSALMVHGRCVSIGCYAMTDKYINEIYALAHAAFKGGQPFFRVHIFPFELEDETLSQYKGHKWYAFWKNLQEGYDFFNAYKYPPNVVVKNGVYHFEGGL